MAFLPADPDHAAKAKTRMDEIAAEEGVRVLGWREVPTDASTLGATAVSAMPSFHQWFIARDGLSGIELDRWAFVIRRVVAGTEDD